MLWRLPAPVRSLFASNFRSLSRSAAGPTRHADPLRILFCGSDEFSIASLRALHDASRHVPGLIEEIHVAHRPAKPTGRGLKVLREVPIAKTASSLSLPIHTFDTFTGWKPPFSYNLVIAVSFGLLVPPRILGLAKYGGLNVHPSFLPDLRGSAPVEHAILKRRSHTGVSVQTLDPHRFDEGVVLAQTASPGIQIRKDESAEGLEARLADVGAEMLVDVLKEGSFVPPLESRGWYSGPTDYAPKITKRDRFVDFKAMTMAQILAVQRALGDTWCILPNGDRLVMHQVVEQSNTVDTDGDVQSGLWHEKNGGELLFRSACGRVGAIVSSTYAGGKAGKGNAKVGKLLREQGKAQKLFG
ncbi:Formyltransferase [Macroventuria anomochaeta]|uniref:Formyltransferase n=1 Tax=Macroventuria anomochaeta TaxID=301207 RepID=A0ACB6RK77_9PLEO|nr:Formyltransferase [Macroventuria anomochaeta]KAF2622276.1 Formyltransferase [Macroventuria anomochaeta]